MKEMVKNIGFFHLNKINPKKLELAQKLFNEIKYYRIVGKGFLAKGPD